MSECEPIGHCESCSKPIFAGDKYGPCTDAIMLCSEHTYSLSDLAGQYREVLEEGDEHSLATLNMTREELETQLSGIDAEIASTGDRTVLVDA